MCGLLTLTETQIARPGCIAPIEKDIFDHHCQEQDTLDFIFEAEMPKLVKKRDISRESLNRRLHRAVASGRSHSVKKYLRLGADPNAKIKGVSSLVEAAVVSGNVEVLQLLLSAGSNPSVVNSVRQTPLHLAALIPHEGLVATLLQASVDPNASSMPRSALHCAVLRGSPKVAKLLIDAGANVSSLGVIDYALGPVSPLFLALQRSCWRELVPMLISAGSTINCLCNGTSGESPLEVVLRHGFSIDRVKYLIKIGGFPNALPCTGHYRYQMKSVLASVISYCLDGDCGFDSMKTLLDMLHAAGYLFHSDEFFKSLLFQCNGPRESFRVSGGCYFPNALLTPLTIDNIKQALSLWFWSPKWVSGLKSMDPSIVVYFQEKMTEFISKPVQPASLSSLCRNRIRSRLIQFSQRKTVDQSVKELPVPVIIKRYLFLES